MSRSVPTFLTRSYTIGGIDTDCLVQLFGDRILLGVSQLDGKLGTWITCHVEETVMDSKTRFRVDVVLGNREDPLMAVYARRLTEQIASLRKSSADPCPPVLLGISIRDRDPKVFLAVVDLLVKLYREAVLVASSS
jgi:hypothetical protein